MTLVVFAALLEAECLIIATWSLPRWSVFAFVVLAIQLLLTRFLPRSSALRPLMLSSLAVAVVFTVLIVLSGTPSDRWALLVWVVPATTTIADTVGPRLPVAMVFRTVCGLLAVVVVVQLGLVWQEHREQARATAFHDRLAQICEHTASTSSGGAPRWITANESMLAEIEALTPPDERTRKLTSYLVMALRRAGTSMKLNDPAKQREWQRWARQVAGDLGVKRSCGLF